MYTMVASNAGQMMTTSFYIMCEAISFVVKGYEILHRLKGNLILSIFAIELHSSEKMMHGVTKMCESQILNQHLVSIHGTLI